MEEWTGGEDINLGPSGALAAADFSLDRFQRYGIRLPPDNRLARARRLLAKVNKRSVALTEDREDILRKVAEAQWTVLDFYMIARTTRQDLSDQHRDSISLALGGSDLPETDTNYLARNTAFELVAAAFLAMGGLEVRLDEPDLRVIVDGRMLGVAAKRVQGSGNIRRRMMEARRQIIGSGIPGVIAVNADVILIGSNPVGDASSKGKTVDENIAEVHHADDELVTDPAVIGRIAFGRTARWRFDGDKPILSQDMFRQYRIYERVQGEADGLIQELERAEVLIKSRMQQL